ncbi:MAG TPA: hypothetical protein VK172_10465 [Lentimicrobium sp.]|nr:hypothetical protein [Lentimicrobium sp.]
MTNFDGVTQTKTGIATKDVRFNSAANRYLGMVWDEKWFEGRDVKEKWLTCSWSKNGKCVNRTRPELDLK